MWINFRTKLTLKAWEATLRANNPFTKNGSDFAKLEPGEDVGVDLSRVSWIEPTALLHVVLFIERALIDARHVIVRMPRSKPTESEIKHLADAAPTQRFVKNYIRARDEARRALDRLGFIDALRHQHINQLPGRVSFDEEFDWSKDESSDATKVFTPKLWQEPARSMKFPWYFHVVFPLQWIPAWRSADGQNVMQVLSKVDILKDVIAQGGQRVSLLDGQLLADVFLKELAENTVEHSDRKWALIAAWSRPDGVSLAQNDVYSWESSFIDRCTGIPLVELASGDSGAGIPNTLADEYRKSALKKRQDVIAIEQSMEGRAEEEKILKWSMGRWSTRIKGKNYGVRGLYRVAKVVDKYDGSISIRSNSNYYGREFLSSEVGTDMLANSSRSLARFAGTVITIRLTVQPPERSLETFLPIPQRVQNRHRRFVQFKVVKIRLDRITLNTTGKDVAKNVCTQISEVCREISSDLSCLIADFSFKGLTIPQLAEVLRAVSQIADPIPVVIINIKNPSHDACEQLIASLWDISPDLDDAVETLFPIQDEAHPVLFRYIHGEYEWITSSKQHKDNLRAMFQGQTIAQDEVLSQFATAADGIHYWRSLRNQRGLFVVENNTVELSFDQQDIEEQIHLNLIEEALDYVNDDQSAGVMSCEKYLLPDGKKENVLFLSPSLEKVFRFISVEHLVQQLGMDRCMHRLAISFRDSVEWDDPKNKFSVIEMVADARLNRILLQCFKWHLEHQLADCGVNQVIINQFHAGDPLSLHDNSFIMIFADIISSGGILKRVIAQLRRVGKDPNAIVCVLNNNNESKPLVDNLTSLFDVDFSIPEGYETDHLIPINPKTLQPENVIIEHEKLQSDKRYKIPQAELVRMITRQEAIYFNHIVRPNSRHFCFFLDPNQMIFEAGYTDVRALSEVGKEIVNYFFEKIITWEKKWDISTGIILFPEDTGSLAGKAIALALQERFRANRRPSVGSLSNHGWRVVSSSYQQEIPLFEEDVYIPSVAVFIDWGTITGAHIRNVMRVAPRLGISHLRIITFLSQLPFDEEDTITSIASLEEGITGQQCRVETSFLARLPIRAYDTSHCPHCQQLRRISIEEGRTPPKLVRSFITGERLRLRARFIEDLFDDRQRRRSGLLPSLDHQALLEDNLNTHRGLTEGDLVHSIFLRDLFEAAVASTTKRYELLHRLQTIVAGIRANNEDSLRERSNLIRLLAAEWTWLKTDPLAIPIIRKIIAEVSAGCALDKRGSIDERSAALIVLRTASKKIFTDNLPELFRTMVKLPALMSRLLYCIYTLVSRDYIETAYFREISIILRDCREYLRSIECSDKLEVNNALNTFILRCDVRSSVVDDDSAMHLFIQLKNKLCQDYWRHHPLAEAIKTLHFARHIEDSLSKGENDVAITWHLHISPLQKVEGFFSEIISMLTKLNEFFNGISSLGTGPLTGLVNVHLQLEQDFLTIVRMVEMFAYKPSTVRDQENWSSFVRARDNIWDILLNPGILVNRISSGDLTKSLEAATFSTDGPRVETSKIISVLRSCPSLIQNEFLSFLRQVEAELPDVNVQLDVPSSWWIGKDFCFCDSATLQLIFWEFVKNVDKHGIKGANNKYNIVVECMFDDCDVSEEGTGSISLIFNNSTYVGFIGPPRGLVQYREAIAVYEGNIAWSLSETTTPDVKKFAVELSLKRWSSEIPNEL